MELLSDESYMIFHNAAYKNEYHEVCGVLVGRIENNIMIIDEIRQIKNISKNPEYEFIFDPTEYLKAISDTTWFKQDATYELLGIWHSHPYYPGYPSPTDWKAALAGQVIEGCYLIFTTTSNELYFYYWDGQIFRVLRTK